jgi:adenine-specific DNA-methyltransferase
VIQDGFSIYLNSALGRESSSWAPRPYNSWRLLHSLTTFPKVSDLFDVKQGVRTGGNKAFVLSQNKWEELPKNEQIYFRPAVVNKSIRYGYLSPVAYVFYPYGRFTIESESKLSKILKKYYELYLLPAKVDLCKRPKVNPNKWWDLTRHREWQIDRTPKLVSTYFGDAGSFAWDESGDYVVVQGMGWLFKRLQKSFIAYRRMCLAYLAILNSSIFSELLSATSNHVSGGQWNLSKKFVDNIALPDLSDQRIESSLVDELAQIGDQMCQGVAIDDKKHQELTHRLFSVDQLL